MVFALLRRRADKIKAEKSKVKAGKGKAAVKKGEESQPPPIGKVDPAPESPLGEAPQIDLPESVSNTLYFLHEVVCPGSQCGSLTKDIQLFY